MEKIMKKREAAQAGEEFYFTGKPCKNGHMSKRKTSSANCLECLRERDSRKKDNLEKYLLGRKKGNAKHLGIDFNITIEDVVIPEKCPILGIPISISHGKQGGSDNSPSIDRWDNSKGYVKGNVRVISNKANRLKGDLTVGQARSLLKYMEGD